MLQGIGVISPQLNIKQFTSSIKESSTAVGFFDIFQQKVSEETPVLNVKEFKQSLKTPVEISQKEESAILGTKNFLNSAWLKMMSLSDEENDSKWISAKVSEKKTVTTDDSNSDLELTQEDSKTLLALLSSLFGNRTDIILQNQSISQISDTGSIDSSVDDSLKNLNKLLANIISEKSVPLDSIILNLSNLSQQNSLPQDDSLQSQVSSLLNEFTVQLENPKLQGDTESLKVIQSLIEKLKLSVNEGKDFTIIHLEPSELGKIFVGYDAESGEKNLQMAVSSETVKSMIENNLGKLQEALKNNGIEVKELNLEKINFSKSITEEDFKSSKDGEMLSDDMKDFINLFVKTKTKNDDLENSFQNFSGAVFTKLNDSLKAEGSDTGENLPAQKIIDTVVKKISQSVAEGKSEIEIKLVPENLGKLTVKIISDEGKLSANIEVKNLDVKQTLDAGIVKLRDDLGLNGIHVDQINVSLSDDYYSQSHQERFLNQGEQKSNGTGNLVASDIEEPELIRNLGYNTLEYSIKKEEE